jgi:hypothetical protein
LPIAIGPDLVATLPQLYHHVVHHFHSIEIALEGEVMHVIYADELVDAIADELAQTLAYLFSLCF